VKFLIDNVWIIAIALISGGTLLFPLLQRRGEKVSLLQATQLINQGKVVLVDVRDAEEFAQGSIRDAKNIPLNALAERAGELEKWKAKTVIAFCQTGVRSSKATSLLKKAGYNEVYSLDGGLTAWRTQGLPVVK
jgi:rhodanese-related sulfurtransferase